MTVQGNYQLLDAIQRDLAELQANSPALSILLGEKIKNFYQKNGMRLRILNGKRIDLIKQHCMLDAQENPMLKEDEQGKKQYSWLSDEHKAEFEKDMLDLYQITFDIYA